MNHRKGIIPGQLRAAAWILLTVFLASLLAGCGQAPAPQVSAPPASPTTEPAAIQTPLPTEPPTAVPTPLPTTTNTPQPTATATIPPTETPVPPLAVVEDGFNAWCVPQSYAGIQPTGPDAPVDANLLAAKPEGLQVKIPAGFCTMIYRFNQPVPGGVSLALFDSSSPFLKIPLKPVEGHPDEVWATVSHDYVVNPPFWEVTYRLVVLDAQDKELWSEPVKFAKPLPSPCQYGGLPDPVTLYCTGTDPKEIEPHPDVTWPAFYTRVPPSN